ncbi:hypothetical protein [Robbsia andropogonis]|nr:hypothetical protein [Robbsia andropogonis]
MIDPNDLRGLAEAIRNVGPILKTLLGPATRQFGLLLGDRIEDWRAERAAKIIEKSRDRLPVPIDGRPIAKERVLYQLLDAGSWADDDLMQGLWSGLLVSSCSAEGGNDTNLPLIRLLGQLTRGQALLLEKVMAEVRILDGIEALTADRTLGYSVDDLLQVMELKIPADVRAAITGLATMGLLENDPMIAAHPGRIIPTSMAFYFYARIKGFSGDPADFFEKTSPSQG